MLQYLVVAIEVIKWFVSHKDELAALVKSAEELFPGIKGSEKLAIVRQAIGVALGVGDKIESAWPLIAPFFNPKVAEIKAPPTKS